MYKLREFPECIPQFTYGPSIPGPLSENETSEMINILIKNNKISKL